MPKDGSIAFNISPVVGMHFTFISFPMANLVVNFNGHEKAKAFFYRLITILVRVYGYDTPGNQISYLPA